MFLIEALISGQLSKFDWELASVLMFRTNNVVSRIFERQIRTPAPGTSVHCARKFYENIVPSHTIYDVECPDHSFRKFTDDGQYLISFSRNHQDLIVYRPTWLSFSCKEEDCESHELPSKAKKFESFFTQLYCVSLASSNELICKDFFLYLETKQFGLFATSTAQVYDAPATGGAVQGVPSIEKISFHLIRLEDGVTLDEKIFCNDFVNLSHSMGVFLYDDLLAIVSLRYQVIHILQVRDSGNLVDVRSIGAFCREDDELFLNSNSQACGGIVFILSSWAGILHYDDRMSEVLANLAFLIRSLDGIFWLDELLIAESMLFSTDLVCGNMLVGLGDGRTKVANDELLKSETLLNMMKEQLIWFMLNLDKSKMLQFSMNQVDGGVHLNQANPSSIFLSGIKQRLLSYIYRGIWNEETDHILRMQGLKKKFYFHFQDFVDLIIWRVQFLDRHHLLIKFGSVDGGLQASRNTDHHPAFFAVYNMETTDIISFYQNSSEELYCLFEQFCDHFHASPNNSMHMNFMSSHSNNVYALDQLKSIKNKASSFSHFVKKMLGNLPFSCQSQSPSPYFDQSLFRFDEKV
ncbi:De-etiolated protein 1, Det1 [Dillenia turbinata]|uniref:De-etiolated protein 1, Det1 n=1 Tax=Dillenia turbinata TaxID=194707 RepID=A0AAN8V0N4_9MAGN